MTMTMATTATDPPPPPTSPTLPSLCAWPLAAASRIRVRLVQQEQQEQQLQRWRQRRRRRRRHAHDVDPAVAAAAAASGGGGGVGGDDDSATYCRFFYNSKSKSIVLIPIDDDADDDDDDDDDDVQQKQRVVYDDNDDIAILEQEPSYVSYVDTLTAMMGGAADKDDDNGEDGITDDYDNGDNAKIAISIGIVDSFHPKDVIGANLSFDNIENDNDNSTASSTANVIANINIYQYPKLNQNQKVKRTACHKQYILDPQCCMDFADVRMIIQAIQKLSQPRSSSSSSSSSKQQPSDGDAVLLPSAPPSAAPSSSTTSQSSPPSPPPPPTTNATTTTATSTPNITPPMKCLVILNPYSGGGGPNSTKGAIHVYTTIVKQMLLESMNIGEFDTLVTQRAGHARERMRRMIGGMGKKQQEMMDKAEGEEVKEVNEEEEEEEEEDDSFTLNTDTETKDISHYNAILAMGGDGILFEILQGIHARSDEAAIFSSVKFAILPCGTYNGLATSILHWSCASSTSSSNAANDEDANGVEEEKNVKADPWDYVEVMFHVCKGYTSTLDIASYRVLRPADAEGGDSNVLRDSSSSNNSSSISTTIITNDTATKNLASANSSIINSPENNVVSSSYLSFLTYAWGLIADCDYESECLRWLGHVRSDIWALYRGILCRKRYRGRFSYLPPSSSSSSNSDGEETKSTMEGMRRSGQEEAVVLPKLGEPLPKGWVTYDGDDFLVFWVCNTTHAAHNMHTCSVAKMNDGLFHVLIVR